MGLYRERILPYVMSAVLGLPAYRRLRSLAVEGAEGEVLELGFGSGRNLPLYSPAVKRLRFVEPAELSRRLARRRIAAAPFPVEAVGLSGERIALPDASFDAVVSTWTLCTIPEVAQALREVARLLRPDGAFRFLEHGLSADERVARWQRRLTPLQRRLAGGCHLDRPIQDLIEGSGLRIERIERFYGPGPKVVAAMYAGVARRS